MFEELFSGSGFAVIVGIVIFIAGYFFLMRVFDGKYPKIYVMVTYKGSRGLRTYRSLGDIIVEDNIVDILTQSYRVMGMKSPIDWYVSDVSIFNRGVRVYDAELISDFLFKRDKMVQVERTITLETDKGTKTLKIGKEGFLFPLKYSEPKKVDADDIRKGKVIVERFVNSMIANNRILDGNNPLLTIIYTSLPILLIVLAVGVMLYLTTTGMADTNLKILEKLNEMRGFLAPPAT